jgi:ABC-2 type transport system permease protein
MKWISQATAFLGRQLHLYKRFWKWEVVWLAYTILITLSIGYLGDGASAVTGVEIDTAKYTLYILVGSLMWGYLAVIFWEMTNLIMVERWEDVIEYTFMAPVNRLVHLFSMAIFGVLYSILRMFVLLLVMALVFSLDLSNTNFMGIVVILLAGSIAFIGIGIFMSLFPLLSPERGEMVARIGEAVILVISGIYYPITVLPVWLQYFAVLSPATYALEGMRAAVIDGAGTWSLFVSYGLPMLLAGIVLVPFGYFCFLKAERYAKMHGKLKRSG